MLNSLSLTFFSQIWCGTTSGEIFRMHIGTGVLLSSEQNHSHLVSGIHLYRSGGPQKNSSDEMAILTTSMDTTLQVIFEVK